MQRGSEKSLTNSKVTEREIHQLLSILNAELHCSKSNKDYTYCEKLQPPDPSQCMQRCDDNAEKLRRLKQENEEIRQRIKDIRCMRKTLKVAQKCQEEKKKCCGKKKSSDSVPYALCNESLAKSVESVAKPPPKGGANNNEIKELQNRLNRLKDENAEIENIIKSLQCDQSQPAQGKGADKKAPPPPPPKCPESTIPRCPDRRPPTPPPAAAKCPEPPPAPKGFDPCEVNFAEFKKYQKANEQLNKELNSVKKENASLNKAYEDLTKKGPKVCPDAPTVTIQQPSSSKAAQPQAQGQNPCCTCCSSNQKGSGNMRNIRSDISAGEPPRRPPGGGFFSWLTSNAFGAKKKHNNNGFRHY